MQRIRVVTICTSFLSVNHPKTLVKQLKNGKHLPFSEVLTKDDLSRHMKTMACRNRIFTPEVTLWAFLSQVMDDDHSQQAAVARVLATAIAQGNKAPSANTSAYSQARSRLSEASLATLTREVARLKKTPQNSSLPPSTQHPHAKSAVHKLKSNKTRGGQPGHPRHERALIPAEQCIAVVTLKPPACRRCRTTLSGVDAEPLRHQVWELPEICLLYTSPSPRD